MKKNLNASRYVFQAEGQPFPIHIRKHKTARHLIVRYQPLEGALTLTLPRYVAIGQGLRFLEERRGWIEREIRAHSGRARQFVVGQTISMLGKDYTIAHEPGRGVVRIDENRIIVPGDEEFLARRLQDWLKARARTEITRLAQQHAARIGKPIRKIGIRDTSSLWGSCNAEGSLSFSWRLVLAPYAVLNYVVCHEVAHLEELNHSPAFWRVVDGLCPHWKEARQWLKVHGKALYAYR